MESSFARDIIQGLSAQPKYISSRYFYDARGDELFRCIMQLPEYYLTRCEFEILQNQGKQITDVCTTSINLIDFGAGDGMKTRLIIQHLRQAGIEVYYFPVDISMHSIETLRSQMVPDVISASHFFPLPFEYSQSLQHLPNNGNQNIVLFLGSNMGNFTHTEAVGFLSSVSAAICPGDVLLLGVDLQKDPSLILAAYNDSLGITRAFNLNLLARLNRELGADFDISSFSHYPMYDPVSGEARSYLISLKNQQVTLKLLDQSFFFRQHEYIFTEVSRKYTLSQIEEYASSSGFKILNTLYDCKQYFADFILTKDV